MMIEYILIILNKVNDTYSIFDLGSHILVKGVLLNKFKTFGLKEIKYDPGIFDCGDIKYIWVRQNYSGIYEFTKSIKHSLKEYKLNLTKFYGKWIYTNSKKNIYLIIILKYIILNDNNQ